MGQPCCLTGQPEWEVVRGRDGRLVLQWNESHLTATATPSEEWHFIVVTISNTTATVYQDGGLDVTAPSGGEEIVIHDRPFRIGKGWCAPTNPGISSFEGGELYHVSFYPRPLSEDEIADIYESYLE